MCRGYGRSIAGRTPSADMADRPPTVTLPALLGIGATFGICVGLGTFLGVLADREWGTAPLLALIGLVVGIVVGATGAYQVIRPYTRRSPAMTNAASRTNTASTPTTQSARPDNQVRSDEQ